MFGIKLIIILPYQVNLKKGNPSILTIFGENPEYEF